MSNLSLMLVIDATKEEGDAARGYRRAVVGAAGRIDDRQEVGLHPINWRGS